jgi:hypothetical protein
METLDDLQVRGTAVARGGFRWVACADPLDTDRWRVAQAVVDTYAAKGYHTHVAAATAEWMAKNGRHDIAVFWHAFAISMQGALAPGDPWAAVGGASSRLQATTRRRSESWRACKARCGRPWCIFHGSHGRVSRRSRRCRLGGDRSAHRCARSRPAQRCRWAPSRAAQPHLIHSVDSHHRELATRQGSPDEAQGRPQGAVQHGGDGRTPRSAGPARSAANAPRHRTTTLSSSWRRATSGTRTVSSRPRSAWRRCEASAQPARAAALTERARRCWARTRSTWRRSHFTDGCTSDKVRTLSYDAGGPRDLTSRVRTGVAERQEKKGAQFFDAAMTVGADQPRRLLEVRHAVDAARTDEHGVRARLRWAAHAATSTSSACRLRWRTSTAWWSTSRESPLRTLQYPPGC